MLLYAQEGRNKGFYVGDKKSMTESQTCPLGMFCPLPFNSLGTFNNVDSFSLFCYTDGLSESFDDNEEEFGAERIERIFSNNISLSPEKMNDKMLMEIDSFRGGNEYRDDATLLTCKVNQVL